MLFSFVGTAQLGSLASLVDFTCPDLDFCTLRSLKVLRSRSILLSVPKAIFNLPPFQAANLSTTYRLVRMILIK